MTRLSLAHLTAVDLPPPALVEAAAAAGFDAVGLRLIKVTPDSPGYPLMDDPAAMRATRAALAATGLAVSDIEFVKLTPETGIDALLPFLDAGAELGAAQAITAPYDPDLSRLADTLGAFAEAAAARGLGTVMEFFPWTSVPDLATCLRVVGQAGPGVGMLVDSLHFDRSGSSLAALAAVDPARLPFAHLCDAPRHPPYTTEQLLFTAREGRMIPGQGQIDLSAFLRALPAGLPLGLEIPGLPGYRAADPVPALTALVAATRALVERASAAA
ncbi:sugar phosphate isomerase/epimerase family protein [Frigidibacter sp. MR17.24]|uniref:sugar phosphate isomerase/epimerase family protein n=1 Tax=Frigidibacter sp. MR17.24 TaxID=3127345 RepID=UPI003012C6C1